MRAAEAGSGPTAVNQTIPSAHCNPVAWTVRHHSKWLECTTDLPQQPSRLFQVDAKQTAEFPRELHGNSRVNGSLTIVALNLLIERKNPLVPDIGVDIKPLGAVKEKRDEMTRQHVVARKRQWHKKWDERSGEKRLPTIRMVVCMPKQDMLGPQRKVAIGKRRLAGISKDIFPSDSLVGSKKYLPHPSGFENPFFDSPLVSRVEVDRPPPFCWPPHDLDGPVVWGSQKFAVAF